MSIGPSVLVSGRKLRGTLLAVGATSALALGTALISAAPVDGYAAEVPQSSEPTVTEVEFVEATVAAGYTDSSAVSEAVGDQEQHDAVAGSTAEPVEADAQARRLIEGEVDVNIVRADLDADNVLVAVTWDTSATAPQLVDLRFLLDGAWSTWTPLDIAEDDRGPDAPPTSVAGTEPFSLFYADAVEVVARGEDGLSIPGLTLVIIEAEGDDDIDNALADIPRAEETEDPGQETEQERPVEEESDVPADLIDEGLEDLEGDELLDLEGAVAGDGVSLQTTVPSLPIMGAATVGSATVSSDGKVYSTGYAGLKINTRKAWGADESKMTWKPKANKIEGAVIHHTESSNNYTQDQVAQQIRNIYHYHAVRLGWGDIGYNVIVDKFGGIWEGRAGGLDKQIHAAHAGNANGNTFGITVMGSFMSAAPIAAAQDSVAKTLAWKLQLHGINSIDRQINVLHQDGKYRSVPVITGHRDVGWTDCPGDAFYARIPAIRTAIANYMKSNTSTGNEVGGSATGIPATFDASNVISDALFYNPGTMTEAQIKSFIQTAGASCKPGSGTTCLKDTTFSTMDLKTLRGGCKPLNMSGNQSPWTIIQKTAQACDLNPQVILSTLQKEQSALTQPKSPAVWAKAMGSGCPDNSGCDPALGGFQKQIYYGADKLVSYRIKSQAGHVDAFKSGRAMTVLHNPDTRCGSQSLVFKNVATASLYEYTPYIGNSSVSGCGATGQKNFYEIFKRYFPNATSPAPKPDPVLVAATPVMYGAPMVGVALGLTVGGPSSFTPAATAVSYQWLRDGGAIPGATRSTYRLTAADLGKSITVRATGSRAGYKSAAATSKALVPQGTVTQLSGDDRVGTSVAVNSQTMKAGKPLFVATAADHADALTVGPAVAVTGGSLMLTNPTSMSSASLNLVKSRKPSQIYLIGGEGAISDSVAQQLASAASGVKVTRVAGRDRYETSAAIAQQFFSGRSVSTAFVATGRSFPDALSAASVSGALKAPLMLVDGSSPSGKINKAVSGFLALKKPSKVVVVGGGGAVSSAVENSLRASHAGTTRISGSDRYQTNLALNDYLSKNGGAAATGLWIATGRDFPDALSAAVPAASTNQRLVLTTGVCLRKPVVSSWIQGSSSKITQATLVGGTSVLGPNIKNLRECS